MNVKKKIENKLQDQEFDWYSKSLNFCLGRDTCLLNVYQSINAPNWVAFVKYRMGIVTSELKELEAMA